MPKHPARSRSGVAGPRATAAAATVAAAVFVAPAAYTAAITPAASVESAATHSTVPAALAGPAAGAVVTAPAAATVPAGAPESMRTAVLADAQPRTLVTLLAPPTPVTVPAPAPAQAQAPVPAQAPAQVPVPVIGVSKGAVALAAAMSVRGTPYHWGAAGMGGFDCSGLALWAYRKAGVSLPHSSRGQSGIGTPVSRADLRPGDLVFFYRPVSHVGIYVGDGNVVHAPQSGDVVKISPIGRMPFAGARRL